MKGPQLAFSWEGLFLRRKLISFLLYFAIFFLVAFLSFLASFGFHDFFFLGEQE